MGTELAIDRAKFKQWIADLRSVLMNEWDPIGIRRVPECWNEYDRYLKRVATLIHEGSTDQRLFSYLNWVEKDQMGVRGHKKRLRKVIASLRAVGPISE